MDSVDVEGLFVFAKPFVRMAQRLSSILDWTTGKVCRSQASNLAMRRTFSGVSHTRVFYSIFLKIHFI